MTNGLRRPVLVAVLALTLGIPLAAPARAELRIPSGYAPSRTDLAGGVTHLKLTGEGQKINVGYLPGGAGAKLRAVVGGPNRIATSKSKLEKASAMCRRVGCIVGINGDFHTSGQPLGGVVSRGVMLRSPLSNRPDVWIGPDGRLGAGILGWSGSVSAPGAATIPLSAVNRNLGNEQTVLYSPAWGSSSTKTKKGTVEIRARFLDSPVTRLGSPVRLELLSIGTKGNTKLGGDVVVLAGRGAAASRLQNLWGGRGAFGGVASLSINTAWPVTDSLGAGNVILSDGQNVAPKASGFYTGTEPRSVIGWNRTTGEVWLVAVDGRQAPSKGVSVPWMAEFLKTLGATDAANLDGGGGTAFIKNGAVANNPSDGGTSGSKGKERGTPDAWMFVPN